jgi:choline transport protein
MWAATVVPFITNLWFRKIITPLEAFGAMCHVGLFSASIITLRVLGKHSTVEYVFHTLTNDPAVAWGIGLLTMTYPLTGKPNPSSEPF